jgi:hypothetical protein
MTNMASAMTHGQLEEVNRLKVLRSHTKGSPPANESGPGTVGCRLADTQLQQCQYPTKIISN